jgi:hypothetical protein
MYIGNKSRPHWFGKDDTLIGGAVSIVAQEADVDDG